MVAVLVTLQRSFPPCGLERIKEGPVDTHRGGFKKCSLRRKKEGSCYDVLSSTCTVDATLTGHGKAMSVVFPNSDECSAQAGR